MTKEFIGTYACAICRNRVRVYDWMPTDLVCCAKCRRDIADDEEKAQSEEEF